MKGSRYIVLFLVLLGHVAGVAGCDKDEPVVTAYAACTQDSDCTQGKRCLEWSFAHEEITSHQCAENCCAAPAVEKLATARRDANKNQQSRVASAHCQPILAAISGANDRVNALASVEVKTRQESLTNASDLHAAFVAQLTKLKAIKVAEPKLKKPFASFLVSFEQQAVAANKLKEAVQKGGPPAELGKRLKSAAAELEQAQVKSNEAVATIAGLCTALVIKPVVAP